MNCHNSTIGRPRRISLSSRARTRPASNEGSAVGLWTGVPRIMSTYLTKLDFSSTLAKSITSNFLIDNFQQVSSHVAGSSSSASFASSASCISNRPSPRLESPVSHRKQTIAPISNRPKFAVCNFHLFRAPEFTPTRLVGAQSFRSYWPLSTDHCPLSSLIANEIQCAALTLSVAEGPGNAPVSPREPRISASNSGLSTINFQLAAPSSVAARSSQCDNCAEKSTSGPRRNPPPRLGE